MARRDDQVLSDDVMEQGKVEYRKMVSEEEARFWEVWNKIDTGERLVIWNRHAISGAFGRRTTDWEAVRVLEAQWGWTYDDLIKAVNRWYGGPTGDGHRYVMMNSAAAKLPYKPAVGLKIGPPIGHRSPGGRRVPTEWPEEDDEYPV